VLLLVSRQLNNRESLPGHVYRELIEAFQRRAREENKTSGSFLVEDEGDTNENQVFRKRRQDTHAVIKYVTATLLETRPGFGCSTSMTEMTATAVESLVFGEIYDLVMEEIEEEKKSIDEDLLEKIANFERNHQGEDEKMNECSPKHIDCNSCISESAIRALHDLPQAHSAVDKLRYCVLFLEQISDYYSGTKNQDALGADSLLKMVCQHVIAAKVFGINAEVAFLEGTFEMKNAVYDFFFRNSTEHLNFLQNLPVTNNY
jgi:hypothetical protein